MFQLESHWMDFTEIWYGLCALGENPEVILFQLLVISNTNMTAEQKVDLGHFCFNVIILPLSG
jgi:hypothetical protein